MIFITILCATIAGILANPLSINNGSSANGKLIGATTVSNTLSAPFIASVNHDDPGFLCAGVIIHDHKILTTAECIYAYAFEDPVRVYVEVGGVIPGTPEPNKFVYNIKRIVIHPEFHSKEMIYYNNIALMRTTVDMFWTIYVSPITLPPNGGTVVPGSTGSVAGWGGSSNSIPSTKLEISTINVIWGETDCKIHSGMIIEKEFCTDPMASASACKYDHGNPLFQHSSVSGSILIGIVNYAPCTTTNYPTIYTNIGDYVSWMLTTPLP